MSDEAQVSADLESQEEPDSTAEQLAALSQPSRRARIWLGDAPTDPLPIVERLRYTPYRTTHSADDQHAADREEQAALEAVDIALRLGELMLRCGAAAADVEASIMAVSAAAGLRRLEIDITVQSLHMQCVLTDGQAITRLRVVQSSRQDFARLDAIHRLVHEISSAGWDAARVRRQLRRIQIHRRNYPDWLVIPSTGLFAGAVTLMLGGGFVAVLIATMSAVVVRETTRFLGRHGYPEFYQVAFGSFVATAIAWVAFVLGAQGWLPLSGADFAYMVAGGIIVLLPGRAMASAVEDVISGYQVTGAGRMLAVFLNTSALIIGVAGALSVTLAISEALQFEFVSPEVLDLRSFGAPLLSAVTGALLLGFFAAITVYSRRRLLIPIALLSAFGVLVSRLVADPLGAGTTTAVGIAAVVIGILGALIASRAGAPAMTVIVPASFGLLPGLTIFRGLYEMVIFSGPDVGALSAMTGLTTLLGAVATLMAIATGTTLGNIVMSPLSHHWNRSQRDKRRRRQG